jgi:hypothetical protein
MLHVYLYNHSFEDLRKQNTIDLTKIPTDLLADECDNIVQHHKTCVLFFGYLDVGWMLDPKHEARIRNAIRKFEVHMVTFHLESLPHSWKNEIDTLYVRSSKNEHAKAINDGSALHAESPAQD